MYTCIWTDQSSLVITVLKHCEDFFFSLNLKGKFYFQTFKHVKVKFATNWVFLFSLISFSVNA